MMAMQELVVPKSIPKMWLIYEGTPATPVPPGVAISLYIKVQEVKNYPLLKFGNNGTHITPLWHRDADNVTLLAHQQGAAFG
jgi:hypothetical protein